MPVTKELRGEARNTTASATSSAEATLPSGWSAAASRQAAAKEHDVRIGATDVYHLFRLPIADEVAMRERLRQPGTGRVRAEVASLSPEQRLGALGNLTQGTPLRRVRDRSTAGRWARSDVQPRSAVSAPPMRVALPMQDRLSHTSAFTRRSYDLLGRATARHVLGIVRVFALRFLSLGDGPARRIRSL